MGMTGAPDMSEKAIFGGNALSRVITPLTGWTRRNTVIMKNKCTITQPSVNKKRFLQGGTGIKKKNLGSIFFVGPTTKGLPTYVIRHKSIYGNMTSSELRFGTSSNPELGLAFKIIIT